MTIHRTQTTQQNGIKKRAASLSNSLLFKGLNQHRRVNSSRPLTIIAGRKKKLIPESACLITPTWATTNNNDTEGLGNTLAQQTTSPTATNTTHHGSTPEIVSKATATTTTTPPVTSNSTTPKNIQQQESPPSLVQEEQDSVPPPADYDDDDENEDNEEDVFEVIIPEWANYHQLEQINDNEEINEEINLKKRITTETTELASRVDGVWLWRKHLSKAETIAWREVLKKAPLIEENEPPMITAATNTAENNSNDNDYEAITMTTSSTFNFEVLPCTCLIAPTSCILDRHKLANVLVRPRSIVRLPPKMPSSSSSPSPPSSQEDKTDSHHDEEGKNNKKIQKKKKKKKKKKKMTIKYWTVFDNEENTSTTANTSHADLKSTTTAVLWVPRFLPTFHETLSMLVNQIKQLPNNNPKSKKLRKKQRHFFKKLKKKSQKRSFSFQQTILEWAERYTTAQYENIKIVVEDPGGPPRVRDAFLSALQEWRSLHGLPVSLVLILGKKNQSMWSASSSLDMTPYLNNCGMRLRHVRLDANLWISCFWNQVLQLDNNNNGYETATKRFMPIPSKIFRESETQYTRDHGSFTRWVHDSLCQSIEQFFSFRGSSMWNLSTSIPKSIFAAWCCSHFSAKVLFSSTSRSSTSKIALLEGFKKCQVIESRYNIFFPLQIQTLLLQLTTTTTLCRVDEDEWNFGRLRGYDEDNNNRDENHNMNRLSILAGMHHYLLSLVSLKSLSNTNKQRREVAVTNKQITFSGRSSEFLKHCLIRKSADIHTESIAMNGDHEDVDDPIIGQHAVSFPSNQTLRNMLILVNELLILLERSGAPQHQDNTSHQTSRKGLVVEKGISQLVDKLDQYIGDEMDKCMDEWKNANPLHDDHSDNGGIRQTGQEEVEKAIIDDDSRQKGGPLQEEWGKVIKDDNRTKGGQLLIEEGKPVSDDIGLYKAGQQQHEGENSSDNRNKGGQLQVEGEEFELDKKADNARHHHETLPIILRREIVENLPISARTMYALLHEKKYISREKWLYSYGAKEDQFSMGLRVLSMYGLVLVKRRRGGKLSYKKKKVLLMKT